MSLQRKKRMTFDDWVATDIYDGYKIPATEEEDDA